VNGRALTPTQIRYVIGDATDQEVVDSPKIIAHVCNDIGLWGRGFVVAVSNRWPEPEQRYRQTWSEWQGETLPLGGVQLVPVRGAGPRRLWVVNMIAQRGVRSTGNPVPIQYDALRKCLHQVAMCARQWGASVHLPRIGCGLAGGTWNKVEPLIEAELCALGVPVTVYDLPQRRQQQAGQESREEHNA